MTLSWIPEIFGFNSCDCSYWACSFEFCSFVSLFVLFMLKTKMMIKLFTMCYFLSLRWVFWSIFHSRTKWSCWIPGCYVLGKTAVLNKGRNVCTCHYSSQDNVAAWRKKTRILATIATKATLLDERTWLYIYAYHYSSQDSIASSRRKRYIFAAIGTKTRFAAWRKHRCILSL